jgi:dihydrofolate reductase
MMSSAAQSHGKIALVVAAARNGVIGRGGAMPWHMPGDLKTFRRLTMGRPIIMGRKTFQSIGRALDGRTNIVISRDASFAAENVLVSASFDAALEAASRATGAENGIMVIGGGEIYRVALPHAEIVYLTEISAELDGDTWFPPLDPQEWRETHRAPISADPRDDYPAELVTFERRAAR